MNLKEIINTKEEAKQALLGTILADGSIGKQRTPKGRASCEITHTVKNLDYLKLKKDIFEGYLNIKCSIKEHNKITSEKTYTLFRLTTTVDDWFVYLRDNIYSTNRVKLFRKEEIDQLTDLGLLFLYLDDGTLRVRFYEGTSKIRESRICLCLDSFTLQELNYFQKWLIDKYDIKTHIYRHTKCSDLTRGFRVWTNTENTKKIMNIFNKYYELVPSMKYKFLNYYSS